MEIKIELPDWKCETLLDLYDFVIEEVTAYYSHNSNHYDDDNEIENLYPINIKIARPKSAKLEELNKEFPRLEVLNDFRYEKVVNNLFNDRLWTILTS